LKDVETIISGPAIFRIFLVKHALKEYFEKMVKLEKEKYLQF
jgi:hypothetical protein